MTKLTLEEVQSVLVKQLTNKDDVDKVINELSKLVEEKQDEKETSADNLPKVKSEYGILILDDTNLISVENRDKLAGFVFQYKAGENSSDIVTKISEAAQEQNQTKSGKKNVIKSVVEAFENLKRKFVKSKNVNIKTKHLVKIVISDGKLR